MSPNFFIVSKAVLKRARCSLVASPDVVSTGCSKDIGISIKMISVAIETNFISAANNRPRSSLHPGLSMYFESYLQSATNFLVVPQANPQRRRTNDTKLMAVRTAVTTPAPFCCAANLFTTRAAIAVKMQITENLRSNQNSRSKLSWSRMMDSSVTYFQRRTRVDEAIPSKTAFLNVNI